VHLVPRRNKPHAHSKANQDTPSTFFPRSLCIPRTQPAIPTSCETIIMAELPIQVDRSAVKAGGWKGCPCSTPFVYYPINLKATRVPAAVSLFRLDLDSIDVHD
jgi:hypothetical protein